MITETCAVMRRPRGRFSGEGFPERAMPHLRPRVTRKGLTSANECANGVDTGPSQTPQVLTIPATHHPFTPLNSFRQSRYRLYPSSPPRQQDAATASVDPLLPHFPFSFAAP